MDSTPSPLLHPGPVVPRLLDLPNLLRRKSYFLLGPRQTGKTFLVHHWLGPVRLYDLLDSSTYLALSQNPGRLAQELTEKDRMVVIDEIQRLPVLLNEVHRLIEERGLRFLLTGSSARKLRSGGVNLLGGRARTKRLHPFSCRELGPLFDLRTALARGLLPPMYFSDGAGADLETYAGTYLQQEVVAEGATRNVPAFSRFLRVAALQGRQFRPGTPEYGEALETYLMHELTCHRDYQSGEPLSYWRSTSGFEVDFILADHTAVELKAKSNVAAQDLKSLRALAEEKVLKRLLCVSFEARPRQVDGIRILPLSHFLDALWAGEYR